MKTLYIECNMGAAGDMLTAALTELMPDPEGFLRELNALGIPDVVYEKPPSQKCGISGTHISSTTADCMLTKHSTPNSVSGARNA